MLALPILLLSYASPRVPNTTIAAAATVDTTTTGAKPSTTASDTTTTTTADTIEIAPGVAMPRLNAGHPDDGAHNETAAALAWLAAGGRGIDTALDYNNQRDVAKAMQASALKRRELFITTKISCGGFQSAADKIAEDLKELQTPYVDLLLIHFPCSTHAKTKQVWRALQAAHKAGQARAIGVSNFAKSDIEAVMSLGGVKPAINQCQMSLGSHDDATIALCKSLGITYEAYSPLRRVSLSDPAITTIAAAHSKSPAQVALKWIYQQDIVVATSPGTNRQYIGEDLDLPSFTLSADEMDTLAKL